MAKYSDKARPVPAKAPGTTPTGASNISSLPPGKSMWREAYASPETWEATPIIWVQEWDSASSGTPNSRKVSRESKSPRTYRRAGPPGKLIVFSCQSTDFWGELENVLRTDSAAVRNFCWD